MSERETPTLYGISNCDAVRHARAWLSEHGVVYLFHDFKKVGLPRTVLDCWLRTVDWEILVNRKGTTWRALPQATREQITDAAHATDLMLAAPSIVRRPVLQYRGKVLVGFDVPQYQSLLQPRTARAPAPNE